MAEPILRQLAPMPSSVPRPLLAQSEVQCLSMRSPLHQQADMVKLTAGIRVPLLHLL